MRSMCSSRILRVLKCVRIRPRGISMIKMMPDRKIQITKHLKRPVEVAFLGTRDHFNTCGIRDLSPACCFCLSSASQLNAIQLMLANPTVRLGSLLERCSRACTGASLLECMGSPTPLRCKSHFGVLLGNVCASVISGL